MIVKNSSFRLLLVFRTQSDGDDNVEFEFEAVAMLVGGFAVAAGF